MGGSREQRLAQEDSLRALLTSFAASLLRFLLLLVFQCSRSIGSRVLCSPRMPDSRSALEGGDIQ